MWRRVVWYVFVVLVVLSGCQKAEPLQTEDPSPAGAPALAGDRDWTERGLDGTSWLSLGTLELEETGNAVTPEQAVKLLPLWQMIQSGSLQSAGETDAVVKQIEGLMTNAQMAAIDAMGLTMEDYQAWMETQGIEMPSPAEGQGAPGNLQNMSEDDSSQAARADAVDAGYDA